MAKKKDGLLPVFIVMAALLVVSIGFLAGYNAWVNRELTPEEDAAQIAIVYDDNDGNTQNITKARCRCLRRGRNAVSDELWHHFRL